ncbi:hypothetical protein [Desulfogranum japonicum]|uniref:hypothetical protein n=1 Tax=Desulfogranum japonicum TaxID=231447 RepID=UPI00041D0BB7|nr:hypothetical protein [Desulfogranum japonicum]
MITLGTIELPGSLQWADEFAWSPVIHERDYSCAGSLLIEASARQAGRPITLKSGDESNGRAFGLVKRSVVLQIQALQDAGDADMTLTLHDGRTFTVKFDKSSNSAMDAEPDYHQNPQEADDLYRITLRLIEVS